MIVAFCEAYFLSFACFVTFQALTFPSYLPASSILHSLWTVSSAASVFGVASLAVQLVDSIDRLDTFLKAIQNAPANINSLFGELELPRSVLEQTRKINARHISDRSAEKALGICQSQILKLETTIGQAVKHFNSDKFYQRKWSAFKIILKGKEIAAVLNSIGHAKSTLLLLQQNVLM
jgi:hypothetical protein